MKKDDIIPGELYAADPPVNEIGGSYGRAPWHVKVTVLSTGVPIDSIGGGKPRNVGSHCRLEEELRIVAYYERAYSTRTLPVGHEFVMRTADVKAEWEPEFEESIVAARVKRYAMLDSVYALLRELGLPAVSRLEAGPEVNAERVLIPTAIFEAWLRRIDPRRIVEDALDEFSHRLQTTMPGHDIAHEKAAVLHEVVEGLAVSDAELAPEEQG